MLKRGTETQHWGIPPPTQRGLGRRYGNWKSAMLLNLSLKPYENADQFTTAEHHYPYLFPDILSTWVEGRIGHSYYAMPVMDGFI